jgi:hypothetical protein
VKRRISRRVPAEVNAELLDGWMLIQLLKYETPELAARRISALFATSAGLPLPDCWCPLCTSVRGRVSNA